MLTMNNPTPNPKANAACKVHTSVRMCSGALRTRACRARCRPTCWRGDQTLTLRLRAAPGAYQPARGAAALRVRGPAGRAGDISAGGDRAPGGPLQRARRAARGRARPHTRLPGVPQGPLRKMVFEGPVSEAVIALRASRFRALPTLWQPGRAHACRALHQRLWRLWKEEGQVE